MVEGLRVEGVMTDLIEVVEDQHFEHEAMHQRLDLHQHPGERDETPSTPWEKPHALFDTNAETIWNVKTRSSHKNILSHGKHEANTSRRRLGAGADLLGREGGSDEAREDARARWETCREHSHER